ncbi:MAG TPA: oxalate decarboxylase family bicupin [Waddliaceae bacterium]
MIHDQTLTKSQPINGNLGASIIGPSNPSREAENPDILVPPRTDHGTLPNLKWSFADSHMRLEEGGWARETTVRELPSSPKIAGVNMRLKAGAVREMHWHREAEWSYMLKGKARITCIDPNNYAFQDDVSEGDLWYFPAGIPHSIQGIGEDGCEFLLVFDDGNFSEDSTFLLTDWLAHTPKEVLAKNFGVSEAAFANIPKQELYIFKTKLPPPLAKDRMTGTGQVSFPFSHQMMAQEPIRTKTGTVRITDSSTFHASKTIAAGLVEIEPGGMRELHWHTNSDEWQFYISGKARMTVFASEGNARTFDFQAGDVGSVPFPMGHYIENTGTTTLRFLEIFRSDHFAEISLSKWLALTPHELVRGHLKIDESVLANIPKHKTPVVP